MDAITEAAVWARVHGAKTDREPWQQPLADTALAAAAYHALLPRAAGRCRHSLRQMHRGACRQLRQLTAMAYACGGSVPSAVRPALQPGSSASLLQQAWQAEQRCAAAFSQTAAETAALSTCLRFMAQQCLQRSAAVLTLLQQILKP